MDANTHKLHTIGVTDNAGDTPQSVRANVASAEQLALNRLFGLNLPTTTDPQIGALISQRIFSIVRRVHTSMTKVELEDLITTNVGTALQDVAPGQTLALGDLRRMQAVAKAAYESIPQDLLERFTLVTLPAQISVDHLGHSTGVVLMRNVIIGGTTFTFQMNTDIPFWKLDDKTNPGRVPEITESIVGRTPEQIGIIPGVLSPTYIFTNADAANIAGATDVRVTEQPEGLGKCEYDYDLSPAPTPPLTPRPKINVNSDKMMTDFTDSDAPRGLQNRPIYTFNADEIQLLLEHRGKDGSYPYWKKYITSGLTNPYDMLHNLVCTYPSLTPPAPLRTPIRGSAAASEIIRLIHRQPTRADSVGTRRVTMVEAQRDVHRKLDENRAFITRLQSGSENAHGAIVAASIALNDSAVLSKVSGGTDEAKAKEKVDAAKAKMELVGLVKNLSDLKVSFAVSNQVRTSTNAANYLYLEAQYTSLRADKDQIRETPPVPPAATPAFTSEYMISNYGTLPNVLYDVPAAPPTSAINRTPQRRDASKEVDSQMKEVEKDIGVYKNVASALLRIAVAATNGKIESSTLKSLIDGTTTQKGNINSGFDPIKTADDIKKEMKLDESEEVMKKTITDAEAALAKIRAGGETGDQLQQKIFQEHFKGQGLSAQEAQKSANYLYSRSLIDNELRGQIDDLQDDIFSEHEIGRTPLDRLNVSARRRNAKEFKVVDNIARCLDLQSRYVPNRYVPFKGVTNYDWQTLPYPKLISAYYSFKKLYDGGGPAYLNGAGSSVYKGQMAHIARALSDKHVVMLINDFGNDLPDKDRAELASRKTLSLELMEKMLTGEAPAKYGPRIDHLLNHVDGGTHRYRRGLYGAASAATIATIGTTGFLGKNLGKGIKNTAGYLNKNKGNIAGCAALTALGGPLGFAVWAGYKMMKTPTTSA